MNGLKMIISMNGLKRNSLVVQLNEEPRRKRTGYRNRFARRTLFRIAILRLRRRAAGNLPILD
jgi:hypothetical protein